MITLLGLVLVNVSPLSDARSDKGAEAGTVFCAPTIKPFRRKPPVVAVDVGPMEIESGKTAVWRVAETVRRSAVDGTGSR